MESSACLPSHLGAPILRLCRITQHPIQVSEFIEAPTFASAVTPEGVHCLCKKQVSKQRLPERVARRESRECGIGSSFSQQLENRWTSELSSLASSSVFSPMWPSVFCSFLSQRILILLNLASSHTAKPGLERAVPTRGPDTRHSFDLPRSALSTWNSNFVSLTQNNWFRTTAP